jgi:recombination protein RecA
VGVNTGIVDKSGSWYSYQGERIGQGRENVKRFLDDNQDIYDDMYQKAREALGFVKKKEEEGEGGRRNELKAESSKLKAESK